MFNLTKEALQIEQKVTTLVHMEIQIHTLEAKEQNVVPDLLFGLTKNYLCCSLVHLLLSEKKWEEIKISLPVFLA
tara:strand:- start:803 stop:1027 length:225 start_codon:yes stop_codon:yes gene_type:complete